MKGDYEKEKKISSVKRDCSENKTVGKRIFGLPLHLFSFFQKTPPPQPQLQAPALHFLVNISSRPAAPRPLMVSTANTTRRGPLMQQLTPSALR